MNDLERIEEVAKTHGGAMEQALSTIQAIAHAASLNAAASMKPDLYYLAPDMLVLLERWGETGRKEGDLFEAGLLDETEALIETVRVPLTDEPTYRLEEQPDGSWSVNGPDGEVCLCRAYPGQRSTPKVRALVIGGML